MDFLATDWVYSDYVADGSVRNPTVIVPSPPQGGRCYITFIGIGIVGRRADDASATYIVYRDNVEQFRMGVEQNAFNPYTIPIRLHPVEYKIELVLPTPGGGGKIGGHVSVGGFNR